MDQLAAAIESRLRTTGPPVRFREGVTVPAVLQALDYLGYVVMRQDTYDNALADARDEGFDSGWCQGRSEGDEW